MSLHDIRASLCRKLGYSESPSEEVEARLTGFINEMHHRLIGLPGMAHLRQSQITFASVASTAQYALPQDVVRVTGMRDATNDRTLLGRSWEWYQANEPDPTATTGTPECWVPVGQTWVATQPVDASALWVKSTHASDTPICYVEGVRYGGYPFSVSVTMIGNTAIPISAYTDIISISKFFVSAPAIGYITLHEDTGAGTELARIAQGQTHARYLRIALWPTPDSAVTYTLDYQRQVDDMTSDADEPLLPKDFHWVIEAGAKMLEYEKMDDRRYPAARDEWQKGVRDLKWFVTQQADGVGTVVGRSQLGPWYPAGS